MQAAQRLAGLHLTRSATSSTSCAITSLVRHRRRRQQEGRNSARLVRSGLGITQSVHQAVTFEGTRFSPQPENLSSQPENLIGCLFALSPARRRGFLVLEEIARRKESPALAGLSLVGTPSSNVEQVPGIDRGLTPACHGPTRNNGRPVAYERP
jgi:hypothetical protein